MRVYKSSRHASWQMYHHELHALALLSVGLFLAVALISYNPYDSSWFYYAHKHASCTNWCGSLGAQCAAFLFYLCGSSALLLLPLLGLMVTMRFTHRSFTHEWDRFGALILLLVVCATLSHYYAVDFFASPFPGGLIGSFVYQALHYWFDVVGSMIFLYTLFLMSLILILRFSFVRVVAYGLHSLHALTKRFHLTDYSYSVVIYLSQFFNQLSTKIGGGVAYLQRFVSTPSAQMHEEYVQIYKEHDLPLALESAHSRDVVPNVHVPREHVAVQNEKNYRLPSVTLFTQATPTVDTRTKEDAEKLAKILEEKLERFGIKGSVTAIKRGPVVTLFEYQPDIDAKLSKIVALEDDLALALRALSIRILAPIPGKSVVGFEVANATRATVFFSSLIQSREYEQYAGDLPLILGEDTFGARLIVDLAKMPHLLVAGSTGSGKSVALNGMLLSLLCKRTPQELRLILIDPKRLEFAAYADCAHLIFPIVTDPKRALGVLNWVVREMERRYLIMAEWSARTMADYNKNVDQAQMLPYIVVVIDELADLMMTAGKEVEDAITRISQMARAAGIHMIIATQRPSVDVITGLIKVNFPSRISFRVMSKIDSRTILDGAGAEKLLGRGDMLFMDGHGGAIKRVHGAYVYDEDIKRVVHHIRAQQAVVYQELTHEHDTAAQAVIEDALYHDVVRFLHDIDEVSISLLQRRFRIGYNRAARLIELLEMQGLIMPSESGKTRKVIK